MTSAEFYVRVKTTGASRKDVMEKAVDRGEGSARAEAEVLEEDAAIVEDGCVVTKAAKVETENIDEKTDKGS